MTTKQARMILRCKRRGLNRKGRKLYLKWTPSKQLGHPIPVSKCAGVPESSFILIKWY
jgi:hypothetical protein